MTKRTSTEIESEYKRLVVKEPHNYNMRCKMLWDLTSALLQEGKREEAWEKSNEAFYYSCMNETVYEGFEVFSFRSFDEKGYSLDDIKKNTISLVHPDMFNDPFDTVFFQWLRRKIDISENTKKELAAIILRRGDALKARCFMRTTPLVPSDGSVPQKVQDIKDVNPLMWAHYANSHKGFCAKYELTPSFVFQDETKHCFMRIGAIKYAEEINLTTGLSFEDALLMKSKIWSYENEVRAILYDPECKEQVTTKPAPKLNSIYLGLRCSTSDRQEMTQALRGGAIPLYQMEYDPTDASKLIPKRIG
jgi:hypothetical protein